MAELDIDPSTGMKNYIANDRLGITTSSQYIREKLGAAIRLGREGGEQKIHEALQHLGAALHTLEGKYSSTSTEGSPNFVQIFLPTQITLSYVSYYWLRPKAAILNLPSSSQSFHMSARMLPYRPRKVRHHRLCLERLVRLTPLKVS